MKRLSVFASLALAILGLALSVHAVRATPGMLQQLKRKQADLDKLLAIKDQNARLSAAMRTIEKAGPTRPLAEVLAGRAAEVRPRQDQPLIDGWFLKSADVVFENAPLETVAAFMADAESARPLDPAKPLAKTRPWRVSSCKITGGATAGIGRAMLVMETIGKSDR